MKRVLIFSLNYYPRFIGGAEVALKEITDRVTDIEFHMVTLRFDSALPDVEKVGNVLVHRIGFTKHHPSIADLRRFPLHFNKHYFQLAAAFKALSLHRIYRYDGIWVMMAHSCGIPAGLFKFFNDRVPYLLTLQEGDPPEQIERMMHPVFPLFRHAFTSATYLQAISTFLLAWGRHMGFGGEGIVIPNAVDTGLFGNAASSDFEKQRLGKKPDDVFLVTTSRLVHKNAVDTVIEALALLPENVHFAVYGIGPDENALKALAEHLGVTSRVHFMGEIAHADIPPALAACDIFIRPSRSEGMGNSFVEAMAAGLPVIATQEGGIADFLFDAKRNPGKETTGWAVDADAPEQVAEAVKDILATPEQVRTVTETARQMAVEKYDWSLIAANMQDLFRRMLALHLGKR